MNKRVTEQETASPFIRMAQINVNDHVEKKNGLSYLSWAWAVDQLMRADPSANWEFHEPKTFGESMMVYCTVTAFGKPITMHLPVMNHRNQAIKNPDAFEINKNMMRCLVKAIACHGLGLYIYAGEDLPENEAEAFAAKASEKKVTPTAGVFDSLPEARKRAIQGVAEYVNERYEREDIAGAFVAYDEIKDAEERAALRSLLESEIKTALLKHSKALNAIEMATQA